MSLTSTDTVTNKQPLYNIGELLCDEISTNNPNIPILKKCLGMIIEHQYDKIWNRWLYKIHWLDYHPHSFTHSSLYTESEVSLMREILRDWHDNT